VATAPGLSIGVRWPAPGTVTSFARQALFAFPLYWAVADGPRPLRHPLVAAVAVAANVAFALTLAKYAP